MLSARRPSVAPAPPLGAPPSPQLLTRIRAEYREMQGLRLTLLQARRLFGLDILTCSAALSALEASGFLRTTRDGAYILGDAARVSA
jgi:hypothetical protein